MLTSTPTNGYDVEQVVPVPDYMFVVEIVRILGYLKLNLNLKLKLKLELGLERLLHSELNLNDKISRAFR